MKVVLMGEQLIVGVYICDKTFSSERVGEQRISTKGGPS